MFECIDFCTAFQALSEELQPKIEAQEELAKELWEQVISNWNELEENRDLSLEITNGRIDIINAVSFCRI